MKKLLIPLFTVALAVVSGVCAQAGTLDVQYAFGQQGRQDGLHAYVSARTLVSADTVSYQSTGISEGAGSSDLIIVPKSEETDPDGSAGSESVDADPDGSAGSESVDSDPDDGTGSERTEVNPFVKKPVLITSGEYTYQINDDEKTITISEYTGKEDVIVVPSEIDGYQVSEVGYQAFTYKKMKSLTVPDGISRIGERAFEYCVISDSIRLPENVTISKDAFSYAELPSVLTIPAGVTAEKYAFSYCDTIKQLFVGPDTVVRDGAFGYARELNRVVCAPGCLLEESAFEYCRELGEVVLCGQVEINENAFYECGNIVWKQEEESQFEVLENTALTGDSDSQGAGPAEEAEMILEILDSPAVRDGVSVTLEKATAKKNGKKGYIYSVSGTIENISDEGIMLVDYTFSFIDEKGEEYRSFSLVYDGEDTAIPPHQKITFSRDDIKWGLQSVPASVSIGIGRVKTETELPPVHKPKTGEYLYQTLDDEKLANIREESPVELAFHVDQGGYGRTATFRKGEALDRAVELLCAIRVGEEANSWVTDNYNWIRVTWEDGTSSFISINLNNLEYSVHSNLHTWYLENLDAFWAYAAEYLEEDK